MNCAITTAHWWNVLTLHRELGNKFSPIKSTKRKEVIEVDSREQELRHEQLVREQEWRLEWRLWAQSIRERNWEEYKKLEPVLLRTIKKSWEEEG